MYSVAAYGKMIADAPRIEAYVSALRQAVGPDSVVLDLGCGPGLFALLACRLNPRRVYAIEPDDVIQIARETAAANGCSGRIEFLQNFSTRLELPEPADVIVSDLRGVLPWFRQHLRSICDARRRLLAPGGTLIARRDILWASVAEVPDHYAKIIGPWNGNGWNIDFSAGRKAVTNRWIKARVQPEQLLAEPVRWAELDYYEIEDTDVEANIEWTILRPGKVHGLTLWFDSELIEGITLSNRPGASELIYGQGLFPLSHPVKVAIGDRVEITLAANLVGEDYVWRWHTRIYGQDKDLKADFKQSTFFGAPSSVEGFRKRSANYVPTLSEEGRVQALILQLMDGGTALEDIAKKVSESFPSEFDDFQKALGKVGEISQRFSE